MDADDVRSGAERLLGEPLAADPVRIERGYGNENWRLEAADRELLIKIAHPGHPVEKAAAASRAQRLAVAAGVPALDDLAIEPMMDRVRRVVATVSPHCRPVVVHRDLTSTTSSPARTVGWRR